MGLIILTQPAEEPIDNTLAKEHMRVDDAAENTYIDTLIKAARINLENFTDRAFITQQWVLTFDRFPKGVIKIPRPPLQLVNSFNYIDPDGVEQTLVLNTDYELDTNTDQEARICKVHGVSWPETKKTLNAVKITFTVGYGNASAVPEAIKHAIKLQTAELYERREDAIAGPGANIQPVVLAAENLLWPYRVGSSLI